MTAPGDAVGQAVVNVRTCDEWHRLGTDQTPGCQSPLLPTALFRCPGCQGDGTWLDTSNPTMVERLGCEDCKPLWRPVENGDTDAVG